MASCVLAVPQYGLAERELQPLDAVRISCDAMPQIAGTWRLDSQGDLHLPVLGRVAASDLPLDDVASHLRLLLAARGLLPNVRISPVPPGFGVVRVDGAVSAPGVLALKGGWTLAQIVTMARPTELADPDEVDIEGGDGVQVKLSLSAQGSYVVAPGDRLSIPISHTPNEVYVLGGVAKPGAVPWKPGMTGKEAISLAGGILAGVDESGVTLQRRGESTPANLAQGLLRGDTVRVAPPVRREYVTVSGAVKRPGLVLLQPGMRLKDAIRLAGGLMPAANIHRIRFKPFGKKSTSLDLADVEDPATNPVLFARDVVEVPITSWRGP